MTTFQEELSVMHSYIEFVTAGQDAFPVVRFPAHFMAETQLKAVNLQYSAFPVPESMIYIADAAAIKVRLLYAIRDILLILVCRRSQPTMPGFPSPYIDTRY